MGSESDADGDALRYPREPNGPSADCPNCDVYGRVSVEFRTKGQRKGNDLRNRVTAVCGNCDETLGHYKLTRVEEPRPR